MTLKNLLAEIKAGRDYGIASIAMNSFERAMAKLGQTRQLRGVMLREDISIADGRYVVRYSDSNRIGKLTFDEINGHNILEWGNDFESYSVDEQVLQEL